MSPIDSNIHGVIRALRDAGPSVAKAMEAEALKVLRGPVADKIAEKAQDKAPKMFGTLKGSAGTKDIPRGTEITFGGQASKYAARQHDDTSLRHSGPRKGKYVYEGKTSPHPGDWNPPRGSGIHRTMISSVSSRRTREVWALGGETVRRGRNGWWRYKSVIYHRRHPAAKFPLEGQSHFLYGRPNSAADETKDFRRRHIAKAALEGGTAELRRLRNPPVTPG